MPRPSPTNAFTDHAPRSFERFYLNNVAITEGCGCQEAVIRYFTPHHGGQNGQRGPLYMMRSFFRWVVANLRH